MFKQYYVVPKGYVPGVCWNLSDASTPPTNPFPIRKRYPSVSLGTSNMMKEGAMNKART